MPHTGGDWRTGRTGQRAAGVVVGGGSGELLLASCWTPQLSRREIYANTRMMSAASDMFFALLSVLFDSKAGRRLSPRTMLQITRALAKAEEAF